LPAQVWVSTGNGFAFAIASLSDGLLDEQISKLGVFHAIGVLIPAFAIPGGVTYFWMHGAQSPRSNVAISSMFASALLGAFVKFLALVITTYSSQPRPN
jgi:uncharacterized membrane protein YjjB (DUF3815 family)